MMIEMIVGLSKGVRAGMDKMRAMAAEGYDTRQIGLKLIVPQMGKKVSANQTKLSAAEKAKQKLSKALMMRKAQAKAKAQGKAKAKAKAKASPENSVDVDEVAEPQYQCQDSIINIIMTKMSIIMNEISIRMKSAS